ncbi:UNVERIFIED_CONTAM: hypothetical protein NCL1_29921 [Trichonephila clavipes]
MLKCPQGILIFGQSGLVASMIMRTETITNRQLVISVNFVSFSNPTNYARVVKTVTIYSTLWDYRSLLRDESKPINGTKIADFVNDLRKTNLSDDYP